MKHCHFLNQIFFYFAFVVVFLSSFLIRDSLAISDGDYLSVSQPGMKLELAGGDYDYWIETPEKIVDLQTGSYEIRGKYIYFHPSASDIGDLRPSRAKIIDKCSIKWGKAGIFRMKGCARSSASPMVAAPSVSPQKAASFTVKEKNVFPKKWRVLKKKVFEIYVPEGCKVREDIKDSGISLSFNGGEAWIGAMPKNPRQLQNKATAGCNLEGAFQKGSTSLFICSPDSDVRLVQLVEKSNEKPIASFVRARDFSTFKALSIAISSIKFSGKKGPSGQGAISLNFTKWTPQDGSFQIDIPKGWRASGGTADFGVNGYIRIVQVLSPDQNTGFLGVYYPFYQYAQTAYGSNGIPPQDALSYVRSRFFSDLRNNYKIEFPNLHFDSLGIDQALSQRLTNQCEANAARYGTKCTSQVVEGKGSFLRNGREFYIWVGGVMEYNTMPLQGLGYQHRWGPAPIYVEVAPKGEFPKWVKAFEHMAETWQPNMQWLSGHFRKAASEQRSIIQHYRRMSSMIHKNAERRMNQGMMEHEAEENERMEEFYDTFYALGGEERYDNPTTGEEIDVPIGADKYLYDNYSQTWVGVRQDVQGSEDLIQALKEKGFVELRLHQH